MARRVAGAEPPGPFDVERFFRDRLVGEGRVMGVGGRVLRRFRVEFAGVWSEPHRALHLDETVTYGDGRILHRRWVVHTDDEGVIAGTEATQGGRMRGRRIGDTVRLVFSRPRRPGSSVTLPKVVLDFEEVGSELVEVSGRTRVLGLTVQRTRLTLHRKP